MIPQAFIEEVQAKTDIVEIISSYIPLKRAGRNFKALCPFHGEKTASFVVSPQKQIFHCFGCGEGGGAIQFLTLIEKVSFPEAIEILAKRLGLTIPHQRGESFRHKDLLYDTAQKAASFFHDNLKNNKNYQPIRAYLNKRGIKDEVIDRFLIGYAPGGNTLLNYMRDNGSTLEILEKVSLVTSSGGRYRDLFQGRIIFPIYDIRSRVIGFGARIYREAKGIPKYINSLENGIYSKRDHLFGFNFSKEEVIKRNSVIVTEGYLDMIMPFVNGIGNIVASLGTALTYEQIKLIKRYALGVVLAYDSDKAGQMATLRSLDLLLESGLKVEVMSLPEGYDPDSMIRQKGRENFEKLLSERQDFFDYKLGILIKNYDADSIEGKSKIANEMLVTINKLNSEIEKYEYIRKLAIGLKVKEEIMIAEFQNSFSKNNAYKQRSSSQNQGKDIMGMDKEPLPVTEKVLLKFMLTSPKAFALMRKNLKKEYFSSYLAQKTISFFFNNYSGEGDNPAQKILSTVNDKEINGFVSKILMDDDIPLDKELFKESLLKLRKKGVMQLKKNLKGSIKEAEVKGDKQRLKELLNEYGKIDKEVRNG